VIPWCLIVDGYGVVAWAVVRTKVGSCDCSNLTLLCPGVDRDVLGVVEAFAVTMVVVAADAVGM